MSDDDVDVSWVLRSGKAESDRRAGLGTEQHRLAHAGPDDASTGSGVGSILGPIIWFVVVAAAYAAFYALKFGLWITWQIVTALFSSRR